MADSESESSSVLNLDYEDDIYERYEPIYRGQNIFDLDLDSLESKPWRNCRTREEIAYYFNYGFDEVTFRMLQIMKRKEREQYQ